MSDHTAVLPEWQPEPPVRGKHGLVAVVASVVAVVLIAGGGFAAWQFFSSGGPRPAEVLPDSTFALVTVDLDPSGGQKIEAMKTLRKFPSWRERTGVTTDSDLVKAIFDKALAEGPCKSLDYERDVKPWIGSRAGVGGVLLGDGKPAPVLALQVKDAEKAKSGFAELAKCSEADDEEFGWTVTDDYVVASDSTPHAEAIVSAGKKSPLAEGAEFKRWTNEAGGAGIVNAYLGSKSVKVLSENLGSELSGLTEGGVGKPGKDEQEQLADVFKDFKGAAAMLGFADGGIELSFAGGAKQLQGREVGDHVGSLPKDTAAVLALSVPEGSIEKLASGGGGAEANAFSLGAILEESTGLDLADDLVTLLGTSLSISVGGDAPADLDKVSGPADLPLGVLIRGDESKIKTVIEKVEARTGAKLADLPATLATDDGKVAISSKPAYADQLLAKGSLADSGSFKDVVSHADDAQGIFYVSFENKWMDAVRQMAADQDDKEADEVVDNLAVLRALGASVWTEGDTSHGLVRLALK